VAWGWARKSSIGAVVLFFVAIAVLVGVFAIKKLPPEKTIDVPFTSQAPNADWSEPWQNACEETSIYMVSSFYQDDEIQREEAVRRIQEIFQTKNERIQISKDESLATIAELINILELPWRARIVYDPTIEDLKTELAGNRPIIVPVYAPSLNNPYYGSGPDYHVLVLTGYDDADGVFIVNDPGTAQGMGLRFPYDTFMNAIHDLNLAEYQAGTKAVLFTENLGWWETWLL